MKISALIERLEALKQEHGDLEVGIDDTEFGDHNPVQSADVRASRRNGSWSDDAEELGSIFVGLA